MKKVILISQESSEIRVALLEDDVLEEFFIERIDSYKIHGNIYRGLVKAVVPAINGAFVNLGDQKDGFLYLEEESCVDFQEPDQGLFGFAFFSKKKDLPKTDKLKEGQEVVVQVTKEPIRNKGPRLTRKIAIPARYVVLVPGRKDLGISRRIEDQQERKRIKEIFTRMKLPDDAGFIVRTAGEKKSRKEFERDIKYLLQKWKQIRGDIRKKKAPVLIHQELDLIERVIRDNFSEDTSKIIVDKKELQKKVYRFMKLYLPGFKGSVDLHRGRKSLFEKYKVESEIERTFRRKVNLKCKGHIIIEQTEGLVAVDVNSGRYTKVSNPEETAFRTNCEAAREIARQIRLRDVGGIIIIDFIDMNKSDHRKKVYQILEDAVKRDRAKTNILQISRLGLVEMTRQRMRPSLESAMYDVCPYCEGRGVVKSVITMSIKVLREIKKSLSDKKGKTLEVKVHQSVADRLLQQEKNIIKTIEKLHKSKIKIVASRHMHIEDMNISS